MLLFDYLVYDYQVFHHYFDLPFNNYILTSSGLIYHIN